MWMEKDFVKEPINVKSEGPSLKTLDLLYEYFGQAQQLLRRYRNSKIFKMLELNLRSSDKFSAS